MYRGVIAEARIGELSPVVFATAAGGDAVARAVIDRLADEIVVMAGAMIRRLRLARLDPDVVLGGGVFRTRDDQFYGRIRSGVERIASGARLIRLEAPPVAGGVLLGLDELAGATVAPLVGERVRAAIGAWDAEVQRSVSGPPAARSRPSSARSGKPA
jgi:N-acetylglucosamine kinase-like BadF-type ATPase